MQGHPSGAQEIHLRPGVNRLGRGEQNDFRIADDTVSGRHCEIVLHDDQILVRDLGSSNGTFIDSAQISEGYLHPGQRLRLGTVDFLFQAEPPGDSVVALTSPVVAVVRPAVRVLAPPVAASPVGEAAAPPPVPGAPDDCSRHPGIPAKWFCLQCGMPFCAGCVKTTRTGMKEFHYCPSCGGSCVRPDEYRRLFTAGRESFFSLFRSAFAYPFKADGIMLLIISFCGKSRC